MKQELISLALGISVMMSSSLGFAQAPAQQAIDPRVEEAANTVNAYYHQCLQRQITPDQYLANSMPVMLKLKTSGVFNDAEFAEGVEYINDMTGRCRIFQNYFITFETSNEQLSKGQISVDTYRSQCVTALKAALDNNIIPQEQYNESLANIEAIIADYLKRHPERRPAVAAQPAQPAVQPTKPAVQPKQPGALPTVPVTLPKQTLTQPK